MSPLSLPAVTRLVRLSVTASTQDVAKTLAEQGAPAGTAVWADRQTRGRGRMDRVWSSPEGGLYVSIVLRPRLKPPELGGLSLSVAQGLAAALGRLAGLTLAVKPPNDVVVPAPAGPPRKLCGVLLEASGGETTLDWIVAGIGVNVNNAPPRGAASLKSLTGRSWDIETVLRELLWELAPLIQSHNGGSP